MSYSRWVVVGSNGYPTLFFNGAGQGAQAGTSVDWSTATHSLTLNARHTTTLSGWGNLILASATAQANGWNFSGNASGLALAMTTLAGSNQSLTSAAGMTFYSYESAGQTRFTWPAAATTVYTRSAVTESSTKGTVATSGSSNSYGGAFTATATPKAGYAFDRWVNVTGGATYSADNPVTVAASEAADVAIKALFTQTHFTLSVSGGTGGTASSSPSAGSVQSGTTVALSATANWGYDFALWTCSGVANSTSRNYSFAMPSANVTVAASFTPWTQVNFTMTRIGVVTSNAKTYWRKQTGASTYAEYETAGDQTTSVYVGIPLELRASVTDPTLTYFVGWYSDAGGTSLYSANATITVTPSVAATIYPKFATTSSHTLATNVSDGSAYAPGNPAEAAGCAVSVQTPTNTGDGKYLTATSITMSAVAAAGWSLTGWKVAYGAGGSATLAATNPLTLAIGDNLTVTANFAVATYTVTLIADDPFATAIPRPPTPGTVALKYTDGGGVDQPLTNPDDVAYGFTVKAVATAAVGFAFEGWYKNGVKITDATASYYFTVVEDVTLVAKFSTTVNITVDLGTGAEGSVSVVDSAGIPAATEVRNRIARVVSDGSVDEAFDPSANDWVRSMAVQSDDKIIASGVFSEIAGEATTRIVRLADDGSKDGAFVQTLNAPAYTIAVQGDGDVLVGGEFTYVGATARNRIARLSGTDGSVDVAYDPNANGSIYAIAIDGSGKAVVGGLFSSIGGASHYSIARLATDGSVDATFTASVNGFVYAVVVQADGKILIGGYFTNVSGYARGNIARLNSDGTVDTSFDPSVSGAVTCIVVDADGGIVFGGSLTAVDSIARNNIARVDSTGALDTAFDPNANGQVTSVLSQSDGKIVLAGNFTTVGGVTRTRLARVSTAGVLDTSYAPSANGYVYKAVLDNDGDILIGGIFTEVGGAFTVTTAGVLTPVIGSTFYLKHTLLNGATIFRGYYDPGDSSQWFTDQPTEIVEVLVEGPMDIEASFDTAIDYVYLRMTNDPEGVENTGLGILSATGFVAELTETEFETEVGFTPGTLSGQGRNRYYKFNRSALTSVGAIPLTERLFKKWTVSEMDVSGGNVVLSNETDLSTLNPAPLLVYRNLSVLAVWVSGVPVRVAGYYATGSDTTMGSIDLSPEGINRQELPVGTLAEFLGSDLVAMTAVPANGFTFAGWYSDAGATTLVDANPTHYETDLVAEVTLYAKFEQDENAVYEWEGGTAPKLATWRSKRMAASAPFDPSAVRVFADGYPVLFKLYACSSPSVPSPDTPTKQIYLNDERPVRLPSGRKERYFEIEVSSAFQVLEVAMGTSVGGLAQ